MFLLQTVLQIFLNLPFLWYPSWMPCPTSQLGAQRFLAMKRGKKGGEASWVWGGLKDYLVQWFSKGICSPGKTHIPRPCPGKTESPGEEGQGLGKTWVKEATQVTLSMPLIKSLYSYPFVFLSEETQVPER